MLLPAPMDLIDDLSNEVIECCRSGTFLAGAQQPDELFYAHEDGRVNLDIRNASDWFECTDIHNEDTKFVELMKLTKGIQTAQLAMYLYGPDRLDQAMIDVSDRIHGQVISSKNVTALGKRLFEMNSRGMDLEEVTGHLQSTILEELACIVAARMLTLRKIYVPGEAMFRAFQLGLLPFGWNYEEDSLWCLDPNSAHRQR